MKMLLLIFSILIALIGDAQKFFYVETGTGTENFIKEILKRSSQLVTKSLLESQYIIKPELGPRAKGNIPLVRITVVDTITLKQIYEAEENYSIVLRKLSPVTASRIAMQTLIEKNIREIIFCAKQDSFFKMIVSTGLKKDKT
jgi:hypothetical protein